MDAVFTDIILHVHDFRVRQGSKARFQHTQHIILAKVQAKHPKQRQEILRISAHQNRLILLRVKRNPGCGKRQRQQRRQRILFTDGDSHILPLDSCPVPVDQGLTSVLAFQIGVLCIIDMHVGHVRNFRL